MPKIWLNDLSLKTRLSRKNSTSSQRKKLTNCLLRDHGLRSIFDYDNISFSPHHFKRVKISATALIKMVMHARKGGEIEVMGLLQGKIKGGKI